MHVDPTVANELASFDRDYAPAAGRRPGLESLPDGDYDLEIEDADLARTEKRGEAILKLSLCVASANLKGQVIEYAYFFRTQDAIDRLGADLCTLGFDADQWTAAHQRRFSTELPRVVPSLPGLRFRARKQTSEVTNDRTKERKVYHNLYVNARLPGKATPAPSSAATPPGRIPAQTLGSASEIPF